MQILRQTTITYYFYLSKEDQKMTEIATAEFKGSFPSIGQCPKEEWPEFAFIGRSNVGKSSLINMLCDKKELAHTSQKPGKTQLLNYYLINQQWYIVDLPGYGYAKISQSKRKEWRKMIQDYLVKRPSLCCAFVLVDSNIKPQEKDIEFINWLGEMHIPFVLVFTKTDRLKPQDIEENIKLMQEKLLEYWNELPQQFFTSASKRVGRTEILDYIEGLAKAGILEFKQI
ncbi:ribosome biogenesis GTP-binding protein YihA/YsxC [Haliscomenobacter hydrossis]|uniref:Probable GTP-binding protein EngB n=1 Tax=Haliscomenobacter hydrossis (strain ATCC 27775 / DSM 1100 / LMG 10767 / O) TaxID=760192 RepID=F4L2J0_HALH1|nr:ribosome biogenesis GTP-binding protein YihA/YsxC [Haliscomenobacter hydrossis]AEE53908.1 GTP-binding protein engB [Haliscomenobacter hydrossis DSM 1100]